MASAADRLGLEDTAARLVELALDGGHRQETRIRVSSAGVARVGGALLSQLFRLGKPPPAAKSHHA